MEERSMCLPEGYAVARAKGPSRFNSRERVVLLPVLTHTLDSGTLALLWQKFSQGYAELNHLRQCGQREGRARVM